MDVIEGSVLCVKIGDLGWVNLSMREWRSPMDRWIGKVTGMRLFDCEFTYRRVAFLRFR